MNVSSRKDHRRGCPDLGNDQPIDQTQYSAHVKCSLSLTSRIVAPVVASGGSMIASEITFRVLIKSVAAVSYL